MRVEIRKEERSESPEKPRRAGRRLPRLSLKAGLRLLIFLLFIGAIGYVWYTIAQIPQRFNVLVIGSDQRGEEQGRSDVLMVVSLPRSPRVPISIVTIPRDTRVDVPGFGKQKITHAYALGDRPTDGKDLGNRDLTVRTVEQFLGISIGGTIEVTFKSFEEIINQVGGVVVNGTKMDGAAALSLVRNRNRPGGDFARTTDQRAVFAALGEKIKSSGMVLSIWKTLQNSSETRVTLPQPRFWLFAGFASVLRGGDWSLGDAHTDVIPGHSQMIYTAEFNKDLYYWIPDMDGTKKIVTDWLA